MKKSEERKKKKTASSNLFVLRLWHSYTHRKLNGKWEKRENKRKF